MCVKVDVRHACRQFRKDGRAVRALDDVSLTVGAGEFVVVRGPSGSGKTTLLLVVGGLLSPDSGQVLIDGRDPYALAADRRARRRAGMIGFVFQQFHLIPYLTVLENVMSPALAVARDGRSRTRAEALLDRFGLAARASHVPAELSTGERQRTALARALLNRPTLLLADEPTGNLDPDSAAIVVEHIADFARGGGAVLMATHSRAAQKYAGRIIELREGRVVAAGGDAR